MNVPACFSAESSDSDQFDGSTMMMETDEMQTISPTSYNSTSCTAGSRSGSFDTDNDDDDGGRSATSSDFCPLFMDGLPSNFNQNPQLAALASLLDDDVREEYTSGGDDEEDDSSDTGGVDGHEIAVLPTIPEERTANTTSTSILISPSRRTGIRPYGKHDLILQQRKWQRDQRTNRRKAVGLRTASTESKKHTMIQSKKHVAVQKGPRSMKKSPQRRKRMSTSRNSNLTSSPSRRSGTMDEYDDRIVKQAAAAAVSRSKSDGTMDTSYISENNEKTTTMTSATSTIATSTIDHQSSKPSPSVGETTLFLNLWKIS